ncbi:hypothetical protein NX059_010619 [Plenodomus lindquistii]|nr:hypothetical protein NX059_010619 [Plenodomus lindquistii]
MHLDSDMGTRAVDPDNNQVQNEQGNDVGIDTGVLGSYQYSPLDAPDAMRIVVLYPGRRFDVLKCSLQLWHRSGENPYEALSYEWQKSQPDDPFIHIDGERIRIRRNLYNALVQCRPLDEKRFLWIDALCINQQDTVERNHQVGMMRDIYSGASNVIAYLGWTPGRENGISSSQLEAATWRKLQRLDTIEDAENFDMKMTMIFTSSPLSYVDLVYIDTVLSLPYWGRIWIQQELILAQKFAIYCDDHAISGRAFESLITAYTHNQNAVHPDGLVKTYAKDALRIQQSHAAYLMMIRRIGNTVPNFTYLSTWLQMCIRSNLQTSEPRDVIYGMLGISSDCQNGEIIPDYKTSILELYLQVLRHCKAQSSSKSFREMLAEKLDLNLDEYLEHCVGLCLSPMLQTTDEAGEEIKQRIETFNTAAREKIKPQIKALIAHENTMKATRVQMEDSIATANFQEYHFLSEVLSDAHCKAHIREIYLKQSIAKFYITAKAHHPSRKTTEFMRRIKDCPDMDVDEMSTFLR